MRGRGWGRFRTRDHHEPRFGEGAGGRGGRGRGRLPRGRRPASRPRFAGQPRGPTDRRARWVEPAGGGLPADLGRRVRMDPVASSRTRRNGNSRRAATGGDRELQYYTARPINASLDGAGHLAITARREVYSGSDGVTRDYTSALIQTAGRFQTTYGWIQARIKLPSGAGLWPAFWAIGTDFDRVGWPASGEIDLMENNGSDPFKVYGVLHGPMPGQANGYNLVAAARSASSLAVGFHVFGIDWSPGKIVFTLDGVRYATRTPASVASRRSVGVRQAVLPDPEPRRGRELPRAARRYDALPRGDARRLGPRVLQVTPARTYVRRPFTRLALHRRSGRSMTDG